MARSPTDKLRQQHTGDTVRIIIDTARKMFAERGYHNVGIREFAAQANVTPGAIYHHFKDKESLFLAVLKELSDEKKIAAAAHRRAVPHPNRWRQLRDDFQHALDEATSDREFQQLRIMDAPAVIGWKRWRDLHTHHGLNAIVAAVERSIAAGIIKPVSAAMLGQIIWVALNEASMMIAHSETPQQARHEAGAALDALLEGMEIEKPAL